MVDFLKVKNLNFKYALSNSQSLNNINFEVEQGEFVLVIGDSGSGKTTLLRQLKKELWPVGERNGDILFENENLKEISPIESARRIGMVFQNPDDQLVMDTVIQELAFSLENIGEDSDSIQKKIAEMVSFFGFQDILYTQVNQLSGGQKQLVNLAAVLILQPHLLLLDEPTAQLDPIATKEFINLLQRVHDELGVTIMTNEHQLDELLPLSTRLLILEEGKVSFDGQVVEGLKKSIKDQKLAEFIPEVPRLFLNEQLLDENDNLPVTVVEGKKVLLNKEVHLNLNQRTFHSQISSPAIEIKHLDFQYSKQDPLILKDLSLSLNKGEWLSIVGRNGTGKSTLLKCLMKLEKKRRGSIKILKKKISKWKTSDFYQNVGYLSQNPENHFSYDRVYDEFFERARQLEREHPEQVSKKMLKMLKLEELQFKNPHDTSGGEKQLIALGIVLISEPQILVLDEPTKGLDPVRKRELGELLQNLENLGMTIIMTSHDMNFSATYATRCAMLFDGQIISEGNPYDFFASNFFYTTPINRMVRYQIPKALTWRDLSYED